MELVFYCVHMSVSVMGPVTTDQVSHSYLKKKKNPLSTLFIIIDLTFALNLY